MTVQTDLYQNLSETPKTGCGSYDTRYVYIVRQLEPILFIRDGHGGEVLKKFRRDHIVRLDKD